MINSASNHGNFRKQANTLESNLSNVNTTLTNKVNTDLNNLNTTLTNKITALDNTCKSTYLPKNARYNTIIQQQNSTSNCTTLVQWQSEGIAYLKNKPQIAHHNSAVGGDAGIGTGASGAIILVPYSTDANVWEQGVGLYIGKNTLKLDGNTVRFVKTTYNSGTSWYRVWNDGWIEQGGYFACTAFQNTVTLHKAFKDTNFTLLASLTWGSNTNAKYPPREIRTSRTTTTVILTSAYNYESSMGVTWYACGY